MTNISYTRAELIEALSQVLHLYSNGLYPEEYESIMGKKKREWSTTKPWDSQSDVELCEWERDEYRLQAKKILEFLELIGWQEKADCPSQK